MVHGKSHQAALRRLKRISSPLEDKRYCTDVLMQITAVERALRSLF